MTELKKELIRRELIDLVYLCLNHPDIYRDEIEENCNDAFNNIIRFVGDK